MKQPENYVIGVDFGTDSVRALIVDTTNGQEQCQSTFYYPRWKKGWYCDPTRNQFRQHPLDYIEGLEVVVTECLEVRTDLRNKIRGISVDTTGSTPCAVDHTGQPLAMHNQFMEDPDAMFVLWKDHTALQEANEINHWSKKWDIDYTQYSGGVYSSEWFWAKLLHILRKNTTVRQAAYSWLEHCDWIPLLLCGITDISKAKRSRCAAGHKAMWHESFGGLPENSFWKTIDPLLDGWVDRLYQDTFTCDQSVGQLSAEWKQKWGITSEVTVGVGGFDAHMGAVGGEIAPHFLSKVMGTSTCDILISPLTDKEDLVRGICGQVNGSVIPGYLGLEAGQSGFGDIYAWFKNVVAFGATTVLESLAMSDEDRLSLAAQMDAQLLHQLSESASEVPIGAYGVLALDWMNGRRTPDANQALKGVIAGLNLGSTAPVIFRSLIEATCFGARLIVERFEQEGVEIKGLIGLGGVAKKSPLIMQIMADVMNKPIKIARSEQTCALGAAMFAATASGIYPTVEVAIDRMGAGFEKEYQPRSSAVEAYEAIYQQYKHLAKTIEYKET